MKILWIGVALAAAYLSLHPLGGGLRLPDGAALRTVLESCCAYTHDRDILGNVGLFVPFGLFGLLAASPGTPTGRRIGLVCALGAALALILQLGQLFLPARDPSLQDLALNLLGTAGGALIGAGIRRRDATARGLRSVRLAPWALIGAWLAYRLAPFVPLLGVEAIAASLKLTVLPPADIARDAVAWATIGYLLQHGWRGRKLDGHLPAIMLAVLALEVLIAGNAVTAADAAAALLALPLWWALRRTRHQAAVLALLLAGALAAAGLAPFTVRPGFAPFDWPPFQGMFDGSVEHDIVLICGKLFLYGSLVCLTWRAGLGRIAGTALAAAFITVIEVAQMRVYGHAPGVSDPLLLLLAAAALAGLERYDARRSRKRW